jgi:hypothetical protein
MPRKTRRVGKKNKYQKRKYVKRTRKYKFLRGGLSANDKENIEIYDRNIFQSGCIQPGGGGDKTTRQYKIIEFKRYLFGSERHAELWQQILQLCFDKSIPFYILTSGSKIGIIRTLQLLELDEYVGEVLCNNPSLILNRNNSIQHDREDFRKMNKYQIIERIIKQRDSKGIFIDNDERNSDNAELCPNIKFTHANGIQIDRFQRTYTTRFSSFVTDLSNEFKSPIPGHAIMLYNKSHSNLVHECILDEIITQLTNDGNEIRFMFADFDGTMSPWRGALPFHVKEFVSRFYSHFNIILQPS